jgi:hypothetical protein
MADPNVVLLKPISVPAFRKWNCFAVDPTI